MKIALIHGANHMGSTYHIARMLAEKVDGEITEFFLPRDFGEFCLGCTQCFYEKEEKCPHHEKRRPIRNTGMPRAGRQTCAPGNKKTLEIKRSRLERLQ